MTAKRLASFGVLFGELFLVSISDFIKLTERTANGQVDVIQMHGIKHHTEAQFILLRVFVSVYMCVHECTLMTRVGNMNIMTHLACVLQHQSPKTSL